jgi:hypothetical protein
MANALSQFAYPEHLGMEHDQPHNEQDAMGNSLQRWLMGVKERTLHPLNALAQVSQQAMEDPTGTALNWSNPMNAVGGGLAGIFAGKGAKTADIVMLDLAQKLKQAGVPDREIHAKTGWTFGFADGKPRFEIDDSAAKFTKAGNPSKHEWLTINTGKAFDHPDLYAAYPELKQTSMYFTPKEGGSYSPTARLSGDNEFTIGTKGNPTSVVLHEFEHPIQQIEGHAVGGSPDNAPIPFMDEISAIRTAKNQLNIDPYAIQKKRAGGHQLQQYEIDRYKQWEELKAKEDDLLAKSLEISPYEAYKRIAGEAEARLTQARMNMTAEQRLKSYPLDMMDVPISEQIVRYGQ